MPVPPVSLSVRTRSQSRLGEESDGGASSTSSEPSQLGQRIDIDSASSEESGSLETVTEEETINEPPENEMAESRVLIQPRRFGGGIQENVEDYIAQFERVARANGWDEAKKLVVIPCYLDGAALKWYENTEKAVGAALTWELLTTRMKDAFQGVAWDEQLEFKLRMRMQGEDEPVEAYVQDVINLCTKVDVRMTDRSKIKHVLRGLKPSLLEKVMLMTNDTLEHLLDNIRKVQTARFMAGQRVDHLLAEPMRAAPVVNPTVPEVPSTSSQRNLESKIEQLATEFEKINMKLMEQQKAQRRPQPAEQYRPRPAEQYREGPARGRGYNPRYADRGRGSQRGYPGGRTSDGRVICYQCNRPGHYAVACRERNQGNEREGR